MLNSNLLDNILYLVTFTFKLAKHKMATNMLREPRMFYSLSHIEAQFFFYDIFLIVSFERNYLYLTFKSKTSAVFMYLLLL